jgi:GNAT superfamily N-acetyltransferase
VSTIVVSTLSGAAIEPFLDAVASLRIRVFRDFPYLYDGSLSYERDYLAGFAAAEGSVLVLARDGDHVVGCATAMPMAVADPEFQRPFRAAPIPTEGIFYFGESVLEPAWRGQGIGHRFFDQREAAARAAGATLITFCAVQRPTDHPLKPADYQPLDPFWKKRGYTRRNDLSTEFSWKDIDQPIETGKTMVFWVRGLMGLGARG